MSDSDETNSYTLSVNSRCDVPEGAMNGVGYLLLDLLPLAQIPRLEHLSEVIIIGDGKMHETVHALRQQDISHNAARSTQPISARAVAVPIVTGEGLRCFVVLEERLIRPLTPQNYAEQWDALTAVLEELLHVRHFSGLADHLFAPDRPNSIDQNDTLYALCFNALSEYMALRWKAAILAPQLTALGTSLSYPDALGPKVDTTGERIIEIVTGAADQRIPIEDGWRQMMQTTYRGVFEPLTRERAYRDGNGEDVETLIQQPDISQSWFYMHHVAPYWEAWYQSLRQAFDVFKTDPQQTISVLVKMRETLLQFLDHVGVEYEQLADGQLYVMFHGWTALALKAEQDA